ncbi:MAG: hypothetical protein HC932_04195 [Thermales bacterium]|nr:hypothetical protein [Thermales bacterium]
MTIVKLYDNNLLLFWRVTIMSSYESFQDLINLYELEKSIENKDSLFIKDIINDILECPSVYEFIENVFTLESILLDIKSLLDSNKISFVCSNVWIRQVLEINEVLGKKCIGQYQFILDSGIDIEENYQSFIFTANLIEKADSNTDLIEQIYQYAQIENMLE